LLLHGRKDLPIEEVHRVDAEQHAEREDQSRRRGLHRPILSHPSPSCHSAPDRAPAGKEISISQAQETRGTVMMTVAWQQATLSGATRCFMDTPSDKDVPSEEQRPRRKKVKTRIRRPNDPMTHLLIKREARLERMRRIVRWTFGLLAFGAVVYGLIVLYETVQP
jgi:hypothetical protein